MAYSEALAERVRQQSRHRRGITEMKMFGGLCFLLNGHMLVGVWNQSLIVRIGHEQSDRAMEEPYVGPMAITGRPMKGFVIVAPDGLESDRQLETWINRAVDFVATLPRKEGWPKVNRR